MRLSRYIAPTLKEDPSDAVVKSHKLMIRSGLVRKESAGMYIYLPLGLRALRKIMDIVRAEMEAAGALEFLMPELTNAELWKESGRWEAMGPEMMRIADRNGMEYALAPTHEEAFTSAVRSLVASYRDLPVTVYQMNTKFRDEIRPRFGVIRSKEFIMKDAYSFDMDEKGLEASYQTMRAAYRKIFDRCGLETIPVEADSGSMGGSNSEEFMVASEVGEEYLLICDSCGYRANQEKAAYGRGQASTQELLPLETADTPSVKTIEQLVEFFGKPSAVFLKSIVYIADGSPVLAVVPGDREINEYKLKNVLGAQSLELADDKTVEEFTGAPVGFAGPVRTGKVRTIYDISIQNITNGITGANEKDRHFVNVNSGRDFELKNTEDISSAVEGDACPSCGKPMKVKKGIEVGHIFKLGYKYTKAMNVSVLDESGKPAVPIMGCYGIGVNRTMAAVIEQHCDERGIVWPASIAPFQVHLVSLAKTDEERAKSDSVYDALCSGGIEVLYDDRNASPGFKFADADLIGLPLRITAGKGFFQNGTLEIKVRRTGEMEETEFEDIAVKVKGMLEQL